MRIKTMRTQQRHSVTSLCLLRRCGRSLVRNASLIQILINPLHHFYRQAVNIYNAWEFWIMRKFEEKIQELLEKLLLMGRLAESMIQLALRVLIERDESLCAEIESKEKEVNELQIEIDDGAVKLTALQQPAGTDVRFLFMASRIATELERIGDQAINIIEKASPVLASPSLKQVFLVHGEPRAARALWGCRPGRPETGQLQKFSVLDQHVGLPGQRIVAVQAVAPQGCHRRHGRGLCQLLSGRKPVRKEDIQRLGGLLHARFAGQCPAGRHHGPCGRGRNRRGPAAARARKRISACGRVRAPRARRRGRESAASTCPRSQGGKASQASLSGRT